ncbi:MAG: glycosyltransferase [Verrucomicrobiales bacterium]
MEKHHFAVLCPEASGHVLPMSALTVELAGRGHQITYITTADGVERCQSTGVESRLVGEEQFPLGVNRRMFDTLGRLTGLAAAKYVLRIYERGMGVMLDEAPQQVRDCGADVLLADETWWVARTLSQQLDLPYLSVCNALPFHPDELHPPMFSAAPFRTGYLSRVKNRMSYRLIDVTMGRMRRMIMRSRREQGLPKYRFREENASRLATFAQIPEAFDFPRDSPDPWFHYVGGLHSSSVRKPVEFPWDKLDGRPLIYASLGTLQNRLLDVFRAIASAAADLPVQLVISLGGGAEPEELGELDGDPIVVRFAPQLKLIEAADLVVTHAGMNTTVEALAKGRPMLALPVTNDQPGVAARIVHSGCGLMIPIARADAPRIRQALQTMLGDPGFREQAEKMAEANREAGGAARAADLIEGLELSGAAGC